MTREGTSQAGNARKMLRMACARCLGREVELMVLLREGMDIDGVKYG